MAYAGRSRIVLNFDAYFLNRRLAEFQVSLEDANTFELIHDVETNLRQWKEEFIDDVASYRKLKDLEKISSWEEVFESLLIKCKSKLKTTFYGDLDTKQRCAYTAMSNADAWDALGKLQIPRGVSISTC